MRLATGPRKLVSNRTPLTDHVLKFSKGGNAALLADLVESNVAEFDVQRARRTGRPTVGKGRPPTPECTMLVSYLATGFYKLSGGTPVWRSSGLKSLSPVERFLKPILQDIGCMDVKGRVRKHIKLRK